MANFKGESDFAFRIGESDALLFAAFFVLGVFAFCVETFGLARSFCIPSISGDLSSLDIFINSLTPVNFGDLVPFGIFMSLCTPWTSGDLIDFGLFMSSHHPETFGDATAFGVYKRFCIPLTFGDFCTLVFLTVHKCWIIEEYWETMHVLVMPIFSSNPSNQVTSLTSGVLRLIVHLTTSFRGQWKIRIRQLH